MGAACGQFVAHWVAEVDQPALAVEHSLRVFTSRLRLAVAIQQVKACYL